MPIVAVVVGAIGSAVGTAIGTAIGGSILGVSAATIGGIIGAGIAGGVLSAATGGSFGKGFLMGAAGSAVGSFLKAGLGSSIGGTTGGEVLGGATQFADGTTTAGMLAEQGGAMLDAGGNVIEGIDVASSMGDMASGSFGGAETFGLGESIIPQAEPLTPSFEGGLQDTVNAQSMGFMDTSIAGGQDLATSAGFGTTPTPSLGNNQFAMLPDTPMMSDSYSAIGEAPATSGATSGWAGDTGVPTQGSYPMEYVESAAASSAPATASQGGGGGLFKSTDAWLQKNLGMPQGSTGKLLMGGADSLMKMYEANKLERQVNGMAPMSFEQFQSQFSDPNAYKVAANKLAKSGRTGTLPVLLARMKNDVRGKYAGYLSGAQQQYLSNKAGVSALKTSALNNLFTPYAQNLAMKGTS